MTCRATIVFNQAGQIVSTNEEAASLMHSSVDYLLRLHIRDTFHYDELEQGEALLRSLRPGQVTRFERWVRCCDKRYVRIVAHTGMLADGRYRVTMTPLSNEAVELPDRLPEALRRSV